ncbi:MAG: B12-binding domain-containing radical SAM protein, partial [Vicinamibacterales bacterium]
MKAWEAREKAQTTLAKEVGFIRKPHGGRLRVALAFPNTYFVRMSNLGFQTVYQLFNADAQVVCERVFLPPK